MLTEEVIIPKGAHNVLRRLTGQSRADVALSLALKELIRYRIASAQERIKDFEDKYGMNYAGFDDAWKSGKIKDAHSYPIEQDYMQWETALADLKVLEEIMEWQA